MKKSVVNFLRALFFFLICSFLAGCGTTSKSVSGSNDDPVMMAYVYTLLDKPSNASGELEKSLQENPHEKAVHLSCIYSYLKAENYDKAYEVIQRYMDNNEPSYEFYHLSGIIFFKNGMYDRALPDFNRAIDLVKNLTDPSITEKDVSELQIQVDNYEKDIETNASYNIRNYDTNLLARDYKEAQEQLDNAKKIHTLNAACIDMLNRRAYIHIQNGDYEYAEKDYELAHSIDPYNINTYLGKAFLERKKGNPEAAFSLYSKALEYAEDDPKLYGYRAGFNLETNDYQKAYDDFSEALRKNPDDKSNILGQAKALYGLEKYQEAINVVSEFVQYKYEIKTEQLVQSYHLRAAAYLYLKQYRLAVADYTKILGFQSQDREARFRRGALYNYLRSPAAIADFEYIIQTEPDNSDVFCELAIAYMHKSNFERAMNLFKKAIRINPLCYRSYGNLGYLYYRLKSVESTWVLSCLDKSIEINPEYIPAYFYKSLYFRDKENYGAALEQLDKILEIRENIYKAYFYKAIIYEFLKDRDNAIGEYKKAVSNAPPEPDSAVEFAKERIKILSADVALKDIKPQPALQPDDLSKKEDETKEQIAFQVVLSQRFYPADLADAGSGVQVNYQEITNEYGEKEYKYDPEGKSEDKQLDSQEHINDFRQDIVNLVTGDKIQGAVINAADSGNNEQDILILDIPKRNLKLFINELKTQGEAQTLSGPFVDNIDNIEADSSDNDTLRIQITLDISRDVSN